MSAAKFKLDLEWKSFSVSLPLIHLWLAQNAGANYCGTQSYSKLEVWFTDQPDQSILDAIQAYWGALDEASPEAVNYVSQSAILSSVEAMRTGLLSKSWDAMSLAERKLMVGQTPNLFELGLSSVSGV